MGIVKVTQVGDQWTVSVREQSTVREKRFFIEEHARSWARGQAFRLGVRVDMIAEPEKAEH